MCISGIYFMVYVYLIEFSDFCTFIIMKKNFFIYTEHNYFVRYTNLSQRKGTTFMVMAKAMLRPHYIGTSIEYSPETIEIDGKKYNPLQISKPVNLDGYRSFEARTSIGFPISFLGSNLNIAIGATYSDVPIMLNNREEMMNNLTAYTDWTLGSNISENIDFTLRYNLSYSDNKAGSEVLNNEFLNHRATANFKAVLPLGFTLTTSAVFTQYLGITNGYNDSFLLWNASVGKKVMRNLGEVELCVNDIMNQNTSFSRGVWAGYSQVRYNSTMGRYFLVKFTYNIRSFTPGTKQLKIAKASGVPINLFDRVERALNSLKF